MARSTVPAATDRLAPWRTARRSALRQRLRPDGEIVGGEVSFEPFLSRFTSLDHLVGEGQQRRWDVEAKPYIAAFRDGLQKLGWIEGRNIRIEIRWATTRRRGADETIRE